MIPKLTGSLFRAGRALAGLTRDDLANRSGLSRDVLRTWEISSESIVPAQYQMLCRAIDALEDAGVRFSDSGVHLQRPAQIAGTRSSRSCRQSGSWVLIRPHLTAIGSTPFGSHNSRDFWLLVTPNLTAESRCRSGLAGDLH
jgi:transcriptional regulator with XRE-family HTH domain